MNLLWNYLKQYKKILFLTLLLAAINQIFSLLDPQIFRLLVDNYASKADSLPHDVFLRGIILLLSAAVGVAFVSRVAKNFQDYFVNVITQRLGTRLYAQGISHSFSLPYAAFEDQRSGELLQKLQKARSDSEKLIMGMVNTIFLSLVGIIFVIIYAITVHWLIGLVYLSIIPLLGTATFLISRRIKAIQTTIVRETADLAGSTTETLRNVELVKSLGLERQEIDRLNNVNERILELELKKIRLIRKLGFLQGTLINALRSGLMLLMLWLIFQKVISLGEFFSLLFYSFFIFAPLGELGNVASQYQETRASMDNLEKILAEKPEERPADPKILATLKDITYRNVGFTYASANRPSLEDINLSIAGGDTVAFVGPSGSGKTTMVKLLVGLYRPTKGSLFINGTDAKLVDVERLRSRVGLVSQETQLFAGTIRENLLFVRPDASDADCLAALNAASAMSIVERGDRGLDSKIGEGGIKISGGERQRLAIARALLRNPDLIIFDEATSSLDSLTEKQITETIKEVTASRPNLITVLIAHRLSTVIHAKRIYVLEGGAMVEQGTHQELIAARGLYAALWRQQAGHGVS